MFGQPVLKYLIFHWCRHPDFELTEISGYQEMIHKAMQASPENWQDAQWIETMKLRINRFT